MPSTYRPITDEILTILRHKLGGGAVHTDPETLAVYGRDQSDLAGAPQAVVKVSNASQVADLLALANTYRFPVTPRGAGTGLAGGACPVFGGVVLAMETMNRILAIDAENLIAEVEPGVITKDLRDAAAAKGLFYPPDPASLDTSTIGGNAATNAGGPACVKYGVTRDYVLGLDLVLPTGERVRTGVRTRKGVVGYDLTHLLVGAEGTLGVITGLTLKLIPKPEAVTGLAAFFPNMAAAMRAVARIMAAGCLPSAVEFLDHRCLKLVGDLFPFAIPGSDASMLLIEVDGVASLIARQIEEIAALCTAGGAFTVLPASGAAERERLWWIRRQVSLRIHDVAAVFVPEDVAVPLNRITELVAGLPAIEEAYGVPIYAFGHAGDGNIHLILAGARPEDAAAVERAVADVLDAALKLGGTISGEHGIGMAKKRYLPLELATQNIRLQLALKRTFDPNGVLNPGKIFPDGVDY